MLAGALASLTGTAWYSTIASEIDFLQSMKTKDGGCAGNPCCRFARTRSDGFGFLVQCQHLETRRGSLGNLLMSQDRPVQGNR